MLFPLGEVDSVQFCLRKAFHRHWVHCPDLVEARDGSVRELDASQQPWKTALKAVEPSCSELGANADIQNWLPPVNVMSVGCPDVDNMVSV